MQRPPKIPKKPMLALDTNIVQDNLPQEVVPGIFIGSIHAAFNQEALLAQGITHILNASRVPATFPKHFTYLSIDIRDKEDANMLSCIPASNIFIEAGIDAGGVLVHCFGGRSRSAAFVSAFLMSSRGWSLDQALGVVATARPVAAINRGFSRQLLAYMETHYDVFAAQQMLLRNRILSLQNLRGRGVGAGGGNLRDKFETACTATGSATGTCTGTATGTEGTAGEVTGLFHSPTQNLHLQRTGSGGIDQGAGRWGDTGGALGDAGNSHKRWRPRSGGTEQTTPTGVAVSMSIGASADENESLSMRSMSMHVEGEGKGGGEGDDEDTLAMRQGAGGGGHRTTISTPLSRSTCASAGGGEKISSPSSASSQQHITAEGCAPNCRLSRPGSNTVRVIPPLRGLERRYGCNGCGKSLFSLANVVRDIGTGTGGGTPTMYRPDSSDSKNSDRDRPDSGYKGGASSRERESFGSESSTDSHAQFKVPSHMGSCSSPKHSAFSNGATTGGVRPSSGGSSVGVQQGSGSGPVSIPVPLHSRRNSEAKSFSFGDDIMEDMSCSPQWDESLLSHDMGGVGRGQRVPTAIRSLPLSLPIPRPNSGDRRPNSGERCRPASAEKRRWLARVSLLKADSKDSMSRHPDIPDAKAAKLAADDQLTVDYFIKGKHPVLHIEYLSWMGQDPILGHSDEGSITCPSCAKHIGTWCWMGVGVDAGVGDVSMELVGGSMAADILELPSPQFRILRNTVQLADLPLDSTPMSTPRLEGGTPRLDGSGSGAGGPTSREERDSLDMSIDRGTGTATATSAITGAGYGSIL